MDRRRFLRLAVIAAAAPIAGCAAAGGPSEKARELAAAVRAQYGGVIDGSRMDEIEQGIDGTYQSVDAMAKIHLKNWEEPAFVFRAVIS
ncbi:MAG: hypothetical protein HYR85_13215 [Planctomycetes bacterium]|nr:hypothetical protein [Planctomycetota bacterium]MBI3847863.1 hypothetical protein [Planctomycetota bacterium]